MQRVLIVDDLADNLYFLEVLLKGNGFEAVSALNGAEALTSARQNPPDLVISDILMPVMDGYTFCREWRSDELLKTIPFIFYTATFTEKKDEELALSLGADRFVIKPQEPDTLMAIIRDALASSCRVVVTTPKSLSDEDGILRQYNEALFRKLEKKMADLGFANRELKLKNEELRRTQEVLKMNQRLLAETAKIGKVGGWEIDIDTAKLAWSEEIYNIHEVDLSYDPNVEKGIGFYTSESRPIIENAVSQAIKYGKSFDLVLELITAKGTLKSVHAIGNVDLEQRKVVGFFQDITERRKLEEQLLQSQKMEVVGQLSGGIAHDLNNILTAIIGFSTLIEMNMSVDDPKRENLNHVITAGNRAAELTKSLLAFSRKQIINPQPVDINKIIGKAKKFMGRIISEDIEFKVSFKKDVLIVNADSGQIEQVLMNLVTNARDAMTSGGILSIETDAVAFDDKFINAHGFGEVGSYAEISVSDSGVGMDSETCNKVFEPFFTTKEVGKGTGLGLSIVYGIIKQHNGYVKVHSEPDNGTTIKLYLPIIQSVAESSTQSNADVLQGGKETILVVDDDFSVRELLEKTLGQFGYTVITAIDGNDAVVKFKENPAEIDLVILDVIMPKMNGKEVCDAIKRINPVVKAIFTSGYTSDIIHKRGVLDQSLEFLPKPLNPRQLLIMVRNVLDGISNEKD